MKTIGDSQVIKGNVLIANFMGWDEFNTGSYYTPYDNASYCNGEETSICDKYALKFHTSWDWLMPCIGKISNVCEEPEELDGLKYALLTNNIEEAWKFVVNYLTIS